MNKAQAVLLAMALFLMVCGRGADAQMVQPAFPEGPPPTWAVPPAVETPAQTAQPAAGAPVQAVSVEPTPMSVLSERLDLVAEQIGVPEPTEDVLSRARDELETIRAEARTLMAAQVPNVGTAQSELDALGPAPAEDGEPEAASVAAQRQALKTRLAEATAPVKQGELIVERSSRMLSEIGEIRRKRFTDTITARGLSPLSPTVWSRAYPVLASIARSISESVSDVFTSSALQEQLRQSRSCWRPRSDWRSCWFGRWTAGCCAATAATPPSNSRASRKP